MVTGRRRLGALHLFSAFATACSNREPSVAQNFELERFQGHWFEIARIPREYDRTCVDTTADYTLSAPGKLELLHSCRLGSATGALSQFAAPATVDDPATPAKLTLDIGLYRGSYWVLEVDKDYGYALIGHPSLTMLWVLSRSSTLPPAVYEHLRATASHEGYDPSALVLTPVSAPR
jgi:apolipoprotein D and lipocalin family protein